MKEMAKNAPKMKKKDICDEYRRVLEKPDLSNKKVEEMRKNLRLIAQTICEHVWGKKFY